jgi:hypothetical protein
LFVASKRTYGSPRIHADLLDEGWKVSVNTVAESMRRQGLHGRKPKRPKSLTRQDNKATKFPDLLKRDFTAAGIDAGKVGRSRKSSSGCEGGPPSADVLGLAAEIGRRWRVRQYRPRISSDEKTTRAPSAVAARCRSRAHR